MTLFLPFPGDGYHAPEQGKVHRPKVLNYPSAQTSYMSPETYKTKCKSLSPAFKALFHLLPTYFLQNQSPFELGRMYSSLIPMQSSLGQNAPATGSLAAHHNHLGVLTTPRACLHAGLTDSESLGWEPRHPSFKSSPVTPMHSQENHYS